jgi:glutaredoxin
MQGKELDSCQCFYETQRPRIDYKESQLPRAKKRGHSSMKIIVYKKTGCPWAEDVEDFFKEKGLDYEARDMMKKSQYRDEAQQLSGQSKSPTVVIDDKIFPDTDVEHLEEYLESRGVGV